MIGESDSVAALRRELVGGLPSRYRLGNALGGGGMGVVFSAHDVTLDRTVALKVVLPVEQHGPESRSRFLREAHAAASLLHPNIVPVYDAGESAGLLWYSMAAIEGRDLRKLVAENGPLGVQDSLEIAVDVARALAYAHARGVVHRDVKPDNVIIERFSGRAYLCDFGIARLLDPERTQTATAGVVASPLYAAPEHLLEEGQSTGRTDQYSLSLLLAFMLLGEDLIPGGSLAQLVKKYVENWSPAESGKLVSIPSPLQVVLKRGLQRRPEQRYETMEEWILALQAAVPTAGRSPILVERFLRETEGFLGATGALSLGLGMALLSSRLGTALGLFLFAFSAVAYSWSIRFISMRRAGFGYSDIKLALESDHRSRGRLDAGERGIDTWTRFLLIFALGVLPQYCIVMFAVSERNLPAIGYAVLVAIGVALLGLRLHFWPMERVQLLALVSRVTALNSIAASILVVGIVLTGLVNPKAKWGFILTFSVGAIAASAAMYSITRWLELRARRRVRRVLPT